MKSHNQNNASNRTESTRSGWLDVKGKMKSIWKNGIGIFFCVCSTSCMSTRGYLVDRGRDAADIFTANISFMGAGAKARVGPVHAGVFASSGFLGLRGGVISGSGHETGELEVTIFPLDMDFPHKDEVGGPIFSLDIYEPDKIPYKRGKGYTAYSRLPMITTHLVPPDAQYSRVTPYPRRNNAYFTQIEISVGLGMALTAGFNPGELIDFVLGWFTIDIFDDDLEKRLEQL